MVIVAKLKAKEGHEEQMKEIFMNMISKVQDEEGTLIYTLHKSQNDPSQFMFYEKYKDMDAMTLHSSTPYFKELFPMIEPHMDGAPEIEMYEELGGLDR